jgi:hypothetical protein
MSDSDAHIFRKERVKNLKKPTKCRPGLAIGADRAQVRCALRNLTWALWRPLALAPPLLNDRARWKFWPQSGPDEMGHRQYRQARSGSSGARSGLPCSASMEYCV